MKELNNTTTNDNHNIQDSNTKYSDCATRTINMQETYHEIVINVECEQEYLQDIITQSIADIILEHGDGVEFIDGQMITVESERHDI